MSGKNDDTTVAAVLRAPEPRLDTPMDVTPEERARVEARHLDLAAIKAVSEPEPALETAVGLMHIVDPVDPGEYTIYRAAVWAIIAIAEELRALQKTTGAQARVGAGSVPSTPSLRTWGSI